MKSGSLWENRRERRQRRVLLLISSELLENDNEHEHD